MKAAVGKFQQSQLTFTCSKSTIETLEKGVKYVQINHKDIKTTSMTSFWCLYCWLLTYFTPFSSVSIVDFEQVNVSWNTLKISLTFFRLICPFIWKLCFILQQWLQRIEVKLGIAHICVSSGCFRSDCY